MIQQFKLSRGAMEAAAEFKKNLTHRVGLMTQARGFSGAR
jgi:hypothetical protein